jgi:hypothetical protein
VGTALNAGVKALQPQGSRVRAFLSCFCTLPVALEGGHAQNKSIELGTLHLQIESEFGKATIGG